LSIWWQPLDVKMNINHRKMYQNIDQMISDTEIGTTDIEEIKTILKEGCLFWPGDFFISCHRLMTHTTQCVKDCGPHNREIIISIFWLRRPQYLAYIVV